MRVAALYVLANSSPYRLIKGVDLWPAKRDALLYPGPWPVIAHPPCAPWSRAVAHQVHMSPEQGPHLAPAAVFQVRKFGGILEQPAQSRLWEVFSLPYPLPRRQGFLWPAKVDAWGGWTLEVEQIDWGHCAIKKTWLYLVGIAPTNVRLPSMAPDQRKSLDIRISETTGTVRRRTAYDLGSPESRKRTPRAFAKWLVELASGASRPARSTG